MPRVRNVLTALSATTCLLFVTLWTWSWPQALFGEYVHRPPPWTLRLHLNRGVFRLAYWGDANSAAAAPAGFRLGPIAREPLTAGEVRRAATDFRMVSRLLGGKRVFYLDLPLWLPALVTAIGPVLWIRIRRRQFAAGFPVAPQSSTSLPS